MSTAFLFPGQASQYVGMAKDLVEHFPRAMELFQLANEIMDVDLMRICFEGPAEELTQTRYTQPAIFVHSVIAAELTAVQPAAAAGHSLGEYSALVAAGALTFEDGLRLVRKRGELMQEAGTRSPGTMAAVIGAESALVTEVCSEASASGIVQAANFNSPGQIVISGSIAGVERAMELLKERGVRIVKKLPVSGAFHSPLMQYAQDELGAVLEATPILPARFPVYANVTAGPVTDPDVIRQNLLNQVTSPVLWEMSMMNMLKDGMQEFYETGPGNVLQGLLKRINSEIACRPAGTVTELEALRR
jgi:[acyl-carrier-protein] S-malonyltransferase